jgi:hypothetical protein
MNDLFSKFDPVIELRQGLRHRFDVRFLLDRICDVAPILVFRRGLWADQKPAEIACVSRFDVADQLGQIEIGFD